MLTLAPDLGPRLRRVKDLAVIPAPFVRDLLSWAQACGLKRVVLAQASDEVFRVRQLDVEGGLSGVVEVRRQRGASPSSLTLALRNLDALGLSRAYEPWAWATGLSAAALVGTGIALRLVAVGTQNKARAREGALTPTEAFGLRDQAEREALAGGVLIGMGAAALMSSAILGWIILEGPPR